MSELSPSGRYSAQDAFLHANSKAYEWIIRQMNAIARHKDEETVLHWIQQAAEFAARFHAGRFADGAIENVAFHIGLTLGDPGVGSESFTGSIVSKQSKRRVLHLAYDVLGVGGLTRMLHYWVKHDRTSFHSIVLINQGDTPVPHWLRQAISSNGGQLFIFPGYLPVGQKAQWLRTIAMQGADLVVLHHCPFDVVPTVAFAVEQSPPVVVLNHADHQFWLGSSVSDLAINHRTEGANLVAARRFIDKNVVIPVPLVDQRELLSRCEARRLLGIPEDQIMLLSVGRPEKYRPSGPYDFVSTAGKLLDRHPRAHVYVVGETPMGIGSYLRVPIHDRLHLVGALEDPSPYRAAADVYLESFPFGSQTALLEAVLAGVPPVPAYDPLFVLLVANDDAIHDLIPYPTDENEYIERVGFLIENTEWRKELANKLRTRLFIDHVGEGWLRRLAAIYEVTDRLVHRPRPIPISACNVDLADIGLSLWHVMADGKDSSSGAPLDGTKAVHCHTSFVARRIGNYATARRSAVKVVLEAPFQWMSWRLLVVAILGKYTEHIRHMINRIRLMQQHPVRTII